MQLWQFSTFRTLTDIHATRHQMTFEQLVKGFTTPVNNRTINDKKDLPLWSPTVFNQDKRSGSNAICINFLVFDIDDGMTPFDTWRLFHEYTLIAHTSYSSKPHHHKYRIILPLANSIPVADWNRASHAANEMWDKIVGRGSPDFNALHDKARAYFRFAMPSPASSEMHAHHPLFPPNYHDFAWHIGTPLDLKYDHIQIAQPKKKVYTAKVYSNGKAAISEVMMDPQFRYAIAQKCGANIEGSEARYMQCPNCKRDSVHFSLDPAIPGTYKWPTCNHVNSCGWWGRFEELL